MPPPRRPPGRSPWNWRYAILLEAVIIGVLAAYWIGSEVYYARSISPKRVATARDFFQRFGAPSSVRMVTHKGQSYYEFTGRLPRPYVVAFPSSAPVYVFDDQGRYITWCADPDDMPSYRDRWRYRGTNKVEMGVVKESLRL